MAPHTLKSRAGRCLLAVIATTSLTLSEAPHSAAQTSGQPRLRTYYIAADDVMWNYLPLGRSEVGLPRSENEGPPRKTTFQKALYREYTDGTFKTLKPRPPQWEHLGLLGPLIRAEVGDVVTIVFRNNTNLFCGMHPHGLAYAKDSEGAAYNDGAAGDLKRGAGVEPGQSFTYHWTVPERAGPAHSDASSVLWMYHSHFLEQQDLNTGLIGPIIVTARDASKPDGTPRDVDREFVTAFAVFDETASRYFEANVAGARPYSPKLRMTDPAFRAQYLMYSINGLLEGNMPMLTMKKGEHVRWYLFSNDNEDDVHTPHWHGETVEAMHMRTDTVNLGPMMMMTADMVADNVGTWLFHCHVNEHLDGGMVTRFTITP